MSHCQRITGTNQTVDDVPRQMIRCAMSAAPGHRLCPKHALEPTASIAAVCPKHGQIMAANLIKYVARRCTIIEKSERFCGLATQRVPVAS